MNTQTKLFNKMYNLNVQNELSVDNILNVDGNINLTTGFLDIDPVNNSGIAIRMTSSAPEDIIYHTINDGQGNYNINLNEDENGKTVVDSGFSKIQLAGGTGDGFVALSAGSVLGLGAGVEAVHNIGLMVDSTDQSIRVSDPGRDNGIVSGEGFKIADKSGNLFAQKLVSADACGIGENSPDAKLHIRDGLVGNKKQVVNSSVIIEASDSILHLQSENNGNYSSRLVMSAMESSIENHHWYFSQMSNSGSNALNIGYYKGTNLTADVIGAGVGTDHFVLASDGKFGLGLTPNLYELELAGSGAAKLAGTAWVATSDSRLKTNIQPANLSLCYDDIKKLNLKYFKWCDSICNVEDDHHRLGFIAQDVRMLNPKSVKARNKQFKTIYDDEGNSLQEKEILFHGVSKALTLDISQLTMSLFGCVKKMQNDYDLLKNEMADMLLRLETLENKS